MPRNGQQRRFLLPTGSHSLLNGCQDLQWTGSFLPSRFPLPYSPCHACSDFDPSPGCRSSLSLWNPEKIVVFPGRTAREGPFGVFLLFENRKHTKLHGPWQNVGG